MKALVASAVSLVLGLGLGFLVFHNEPVVQQVEVAGARVEVPVEKQVFVRGPSTVTAAPSAPQPAPSQTVERVVVAASADVPAEVAALKARVAELEKQLGVELEMKRGAEGERVPVPPGLNPRLRDEKQLVETFNRGLKQAGFEHGQVTNVDCSEHPCIVFGTGFGAKGDMEKLNQVDAMKAYANDGKFTYGFQRGASDDDRFFGVALTGDEEASEALKKRIHFRMRQMEDVSRPTK